MFGSSTRLNVVLSVLFVLAMGACGNLGGCGACGSVGPLPTGGLPKDQTIEGGAQVRVTPAGFNKLTSVLPAVLNDQLANGFCVPQGQVGSLGTLGTGARYCTNNNGGGCNPGCKVDVALNSLIPTVTNQQSMNLRISASVSTTIGISGKIVGIGFSCNLGVSSNNLNGDVDIKFGIDPTTGELTINLDRINQFTLGLDFSGCGPISSIGNFLSTVVDSFLGQFIIQLLTPAIDNLIQGFLPSPLGLAGMMDVGKMLAGISPGTNGFMEARIVPGGYVNLVRSGMSLGVITGLNADEDPSTRTPGLTSEPHLCVPPLPAPSFGAAPASLPQTPRSTYALGVANEFNGQPDPGADITMGISETTLDLAGHHAVTSGMMCLGIGTSYVKQLNLGTIGILVPSLADLGSDAGNDPVLLVTRPQRALDFTIGDNTMTSPAITIGISHLEVDFYAFLYERYVRAFTMDLSMNVGVNLDFEQMPGMPVKIKPTLVGISSQSVQVKVLNSQFLEEKPQRLEAVLPSVFDLVTPLLGNLPAINVPTFAGFALDNLSIKHVTTAQDDFLALNASLGASMLMRTQGQTNPLMANAVRALDASLQVDDTPRSQGRAKLVRVTTPEPAKVRSALAQQELGAMPEVVFDVDRYDAAGRELEWSYHLGGGMWRPYVAAAPLVIRDRAFAWQGKYTIGLKSRVKGNYRTVSDEITTDVVIDSVGPRVFHEQATWSGDTYEAAIWDIVSGRKVQYALGKPGGEGPESEWYQGGYLKVSRDELTKYAVGGEVVVYAKDELGNESITLIAPFHGQPGEGGCNCEAGGRPTPGGVVLVLFVGAVLVGRRRLEALARRRARHVVTLAMWLGMSAVMSLVPGCQCGSNQGTACETAKDCGDCGKGEVAFCVDNECVCSDDIPIGRIGPYSDVAVGADGSTWVSAYAQTYGDLVVARVEPGRVPDEAWEWVDGVPDGPVVVEGSKYRGGIDAKGDDVGMYTSIAVAPDGSPMVTYFDRETASLKFAVKRGDVWEKHIIQQGTKVLSELSGELVGMYSSITLRADDGRPGVAYLAHVADATGVHAEVRFAAAQVAVPSRPTDWQIWVVDSAPLPPDDPAHPNIYPLPQGLGLFIDAARLRSNQAPVVVYYDRSNGDLKLAKFNPATGQFAAPVVLDGSGNVDAGWSPSVAVGADDTVHIAYVGATGDDLKYITDKVGVTPQVIDDGYRLVGTTVD
ncbi:MAG TPA: MYXO-CTERM sorting domain-containing protein, partial [Kofleriaceae bacterium]|nr:MYXO-CTERM sorting domain-containing protein [Kofleriaceae bacterium]